MLGDNCRLNFNAKINQADKEDTYLPAFQSAIQLGKHEKAAHSIIQSVKLTDASM